MKISEAKSILDLALRARKQGNIFNVLFTSDAGLGKSSIVQQWAKENNLPLYDLRAAYLEAPDVIGYPIVTNEGGRQRMRYALPDFWPEGGEGVLFLDEPNRGNTSVLNTFMQLLTDRKVHNYTLPEGWMIVACINPENEMYDVNTMDTALKDRFEIFEIKYDKASFLSYMKAKNWNKHIIMFVESGSWQYSKPGDISTTVDGAKYIAPRTFEKLNTAMSAGFKDEEQEFLVMSSILGAGQGRAFFNFVHNEYPIMYSDLKRNLKESLSLLSKYSDPKTYKASYIAMTIKSLVDEKVDDLELLSKVILTIPADQGTTLIKELAYVLKSEKLHDKLFKEYPKVKKYLSTELT